MAVPNLYTNSPTVGSIRWDGFSIAYGGVSYAVPTGSTILKYVWWRYSAGVPVLQAGDALPADLTVDDMVLFGNKGGVPINIQAAGLFDGGLIVDGTILTTALAATFIEANEIFAQDGYFGTVQANQINAGEFTADLALVAMLSVGKRIELSGTDLNTYLTIYATELDDDGNKVPLIELRPEGSTFRGRIIADDVSVLNGLVLQGMLSQIAAGAGMTIMAGVADPISTASVNATLLTSAWPKVPSGFIDRGMCWDETGAQWLRLLVSTASDIAGKCRVERISATTGTVTSTITLANIVGIGEDDMNGIVRIGTSLFVMVFDGHFGNFWAPVQFNQSTGAVIQNAGPHVAFVTKNRPAICADPSGAALFMAAAAEDGMSVSVIQWTITDWSVSGYGFQHSPIWQDVDSDPGTYPLEWSGSKDLHSFYISADYSQLTIGAGASARSYDVVSSVPYPNGYNATYSAADSFTLQAGTGGVAYKTTGTNPGWYSEHAGSTLYRYSEYLPTTGQQVYVTYANTATDNTTLDSPPATTAIPARRWLSISLGEKPPGVDSADVFMGLGTTLPADSSLNKRTETLTSQRTMTLDPSTAGDIAKHPPAASTFPGGAAGWLKSALGSFAVFGDGTGDWPYLRSYAEVGGTWETSANQTIPKSAQTTSGDFWLNSGRSHPGITDYLSLNTDAGRGVWTVLKAGYYRIVMEAAWASDATGFRYIYPWINGLRIGERDEKAGHATQLNHACAVERIWLNVGDDVRMRVEQNANPTGGILLQASDLTGRTRVTIEYKGTVLPA